MTPSFGSKDREGIPSVVLCHLGAIYSSDSLLSATPADIVEAIMAVDLFYPPTLRQNFYNWIVFNEWILSGKFWLKSHGPKHCNVTSVHNVRTLRLYRTSECSVDILSTNADRLYRTSECSVNMLSKNATSAHSICRRRTFTNMCPQPPHFPTDSYCSSHM